MPKKRNLSPNCRDCKAPLVVGANWTASKQRRLHYQCNCCNATEHRDLRLVNGDRLRESDRKRTPQRLVARATERAAFPEKVKARYRKHNLWRYYQMSVEEYGELFNFQKGKCAVCKSPDPRNRRSIHFYVDHSHVTGEVRGLLCHPCNTMIGLHETHGLPVTQEYLDYLADPPMRRLHAA